MKTASFSFNYYDVNTNRYYHQIESIFNSSEDLNPKFSTPEKQKEHLSILKEYIEAASQQYNLDQDEQRDVIIIPPANNGLYFFFAAHELICCEIYRINSFLNYQYQKFEGDKIEFIGIIEFFVCNSIKTNTPRANENERLTIIMSWVDEKKKLKPKRNNTLPKSIIELFNEEDKFNEVLNILEFNNLLNEDGSWNGFSVHKSEIIALIDVLAEKGYIKKVNQTLRGELFCKYFKVDLKNRSLRNKTQAYYDHIQDYEKIFS